MSNIWFTSDTHFMGLGTLIKENRPFKSVYAFEKAIVTQWNEQVESDDELWHVGDFTDYVNKKNNSWREGLSTVAQINCKVNLVIGDIEELIIKEVYGGKFESFKDYCLNIGFHDIVTEKYLEVDDNTVYYLNHFPSKHKKSMTNLFGHVHKVTGLYKPYGLNVSCDLNYFSLYSLEDIQTLLGYKDEWEKNKEILG